MRLSVATNHSLRQSSTFHTSRTSTATHSHHSHSERSPTAVEATSTSHATTTKPTNVLRAGSASLPQWDRRVRTTRSPGSTYFRRVRCPASVCSTVFIVTR